MKARPAKHVEELQAGGAAFEHLVTEMHACQADIFRSATRPDLISEQVSTCYCMMRVRIDVALPYLPAGEAR